jgi:hypothetical protein
MLASLFGGINGTRLMFGCIGRVSFFDLEEGQIEGTIQQEIYF